MRNTPALSDLTDADIRELKWYYQIELRSGSFTQGRIARSIGMVRQLLQGTDLSGTRCLDIGTQEALIPVLLQRGGAKEVIATDRLDLSDRIQLVQEAYQTDFTYLGNTLITDLKPKLTELSDPPAFDIVVFAGVLYHMLNPITGLVTCRSLLREGGLLFFETSFVKSNDFVLKFNAAGTFYPGSNYFQISLPLLEYIFQMLRLKIIDCRFIKSKGHPLGRIAVVARAMNHRISKESDVWIQRKFIQDDLKDLGLDFDSLVSSTPPIPFDARDPQRLSFYPNMDIVDISKTIKTATSKAIPASLGILTLEDQF